MKRNAIAASVGVLLSLATVGTIVVPVFPAVAQTKERLALEAETVRGRLDENSNILEPDGSYYNVYTFEGTAVEQIVIELISDDFDAYLILVDPQGNWLTTDDDGAEGTNAKIAIALPTTGTYQILVNAYNAGEQGEYRLSWRNVTNTEIDRVELKTEADRLLTLGIEQLNTSQFQSALQSWDTALRIYRQIGDRQGEAYSLGNLGGAYQSLGQYERAAEFHQQSLEIERDIGNRQGEAASLGNLGLVYHSLGQYEQAAEFHQQSLDIERDIGNRRGEADSLGNLGLVYHDLGQYERAVEFYQQSLDIEREIGDRQGEAAALGNLGSTYHSLGQYERAAEFHQQSLEIERGIGNRQGEALSLLGLGKTFFKTGNLSSAEANLREAIVVFESLRDTLTDENKVSIFETQADAYSLLQKVLVTDDRPLEALEIAERGRTRAFIDLLAQRIGVRNAEEFEVEPPTIADIQRIAADRDATLVEYAVVGNELYIWVVSPSGDIDFRSVEFEEDDSVRDTAITASLGAQTGRGGNAAIRDLVRGTRASVVVEATDTESDGRMRRSQQSYQVLIEPIADLLPDDPEAKVIFIPHQELFLVPFAALEDLEGNYLIEKHTILTAPSIQVLDLTRENRRSLQAENAVVVGNPQMPTLPNDTEPMEPLPGSEAEAIAIAQQLQTNAIIGNNATETNIVPQLHTASIIHLATHGLLDDLGTDIPGAIALTPTDTDDGFLTSSEIFGMDLNAALVVLSACNTGRGEITGDGVVGLSRSFFSAGTPSLVVSLWAVPDDATRALMVEFYRQLEADPDKAKALRNAMLVTMETYPHPVNWAAFTLMGEAE